MGIDPEPKFNKQFTTNEILETYHKYWKKDWKKNLAEIRIFNEPIRFIDLGKNNPVVFIHGLTSSSYIWRNIMPHLLDNVRCIAPDLMGMGFSGRNGDYSIKKQQKYFEEVIKQLLPINEKITLVLHEWGSILGLDWAKKNEERLISS